MNVPFLDLKAQYKEIKEEIKPAIMDIIDKCCFIGGPYVSGFEKEMEQYLDIEHVAGCASGTDALVLGLKACNGKLHCTISAGLLDDQTWPDAIQPSCAESDSRPGIDNYV